MKSSLNRQVEKVGLIEIRRLKYSSRKYYFTVPPDMIETYDLKAGDLLKIGFIEVRRRNNQATE